MRVTILFAILIICVTDSTAQDTLSRNERLQMLANEIHNLTREPLGEGDLILDHWLDFSLTHKDQTQIGRIYFSATDSAFAWTEDITNAKSVMFRKHSNSTIYALTPGTGQGTTLTEELMTAMGYNEIESRILYEADKKLDPELITGRECLPSVDDSTTVWIAAKSEFKKTERFVVKRGVELWASNQTNYDQIRGFLVAENDFALGFDYDGIEFRVIDFSTEGDFVLALDKISVNIPGMDLNTLAKKQAEEAAKKQTD